MPTQTRTRLPGRLAALLTAGLMVLAVALVGSSSASAHDRPAAPAPAPAAGADPWPEYGLGDADVDIAVAKLLLIQIGFDPHMDLDRPIPFDAQMGHAVRAYQEYSGIAQTSRLDAATWEALRSETFGLYRSGSSGLVVEAIQRLLNAKFALHLITDGLYGPQTEAAVRGAQDSLGIGVDGIAGPATFRALITYQDYDR
ncbi:peptidoglycan-binding protein [Nocardiopsis sp. EMB25]|uniref:peptidoglycan-binding domain-containing protein n=1 Tax=Nocardiopsis TaxID=2013 RepID=UPI000346E1DF|nr:MULTISPECIES: peptidoglycan-binding protein [Nocardiopsis]MCY9782962.1 peptidoglycan-binding protein [Nocardiopsis sp. EMB25]